MRHTLVLVRRNKAIGVTAEQVAGILETQVTAQNNRLEYLRKRGFIYREPFGKYWVYKPNPAHEGKGD